MEEITYVVSLCPMLPYISELASSSFNHGFQNTAAVQMRKQEEDFILFRLFCNNMYFIVSM
jgi:hypothetical protein